MGDPPELAVCEICGGASGITPCASCWAQQSFQLDQATVPDGPPRAGAPDPEAE